MDQASSCWKKSPIANGIELDRNDHVKQISSSFPANLVSVLELDNGVESIRVLV